MRKKTLHIYTVKSFYSYARVSTILLLFFFFSHQYFFSCLTCSNPCSSCKSVQNCWEHAMGRNFLLNFIPLISSSMEEQPLAFSLALQFFFFLKLVLPFDLLEFYNGINMHIDKREHANKIYLDFLRPLTIFA